MEGFPGKYQYSLFWGSPNFLVGDKYIFSPNWQYIPLIYVFIYPIPLFTLILYPILFDGDMFIPRSLVAKYHLSFQKGTQNVSFERILDS